MLFDCMKLNSFNRGEKKSWHLNRGAGNLKIQGLKLCVHLFVNVS